MTVSILAKLAVLPSGKLMAPLSLPQLGDYLRKQLDNDGENQRNQRHVIRDELYRDGGVPYMTSILEEQFTDAEVLDKRKKWVKHARFNNGMKRIVNELSTVYAAAAKRTVGGTLKNQAAYKAVTDAVMLDEQMLQFGRLLNLHCAMLIGFRVRVVPDGTMLEDGTFGGPREPVLDMASPAIVRAVIHPTDRKLVVGWLIRADYQPAVGDPCEVAWTLWTDHERVQLRKDFQPLPETYVEHGLGVCPWIGVTLGPPCVGFWPGEDGEDLVAAHVSIWFANVLLLKETKSATKQTVLTGDGTNMARGQSADSEVPSELADGQGIQTVDMSMDTEPFRATAEHVLSNAGQNRGLAPGVLNHQGVQSAQARELMRLPLNEQRTQQQLPLSRAERALVIVMAAVLTKDAPDQAFDPEDFTLQWGDPTTPLSKGDRVNLFVTERAQGLANTVDFLSDELHITADQAQEVLERNYAVELARNLLMRPLQAISGAAPTVFDPPAEVDKTSASGGGDGA